MNDFILFVLTSSTLYLFIAKLPLYFYKNIGWKIFNKSIDFQGVWNYKHHCSSLTETDIKKHFKADAVKEQDSVIEKLKENHGKVFFNQSIFGISVQEGTGALGRNEDSSKTTWKGISVNYNREGDFVVHFESILGDIKFKGIDTLTVSERDRKGRPKALTGHSILVPENKNFVFRGQITYYR